MRQALSDIRYLVGGRNVLEKAAFVPARGIFSDAAVNFLESLSANLLHNKKARKYPDVQAYAFWLRKASLEKARQAYQKETDRIGRGVAFQIAPSNIPVQFAVSMAYALISGNISLVKVSDKQFEQVDIICEAICELLNSSYEHMKPYICIFRYGHDDRITSILSAECDVRMIWGGNETISVIRRSPVKPRCVDIGFADRYSIAVIDSAAYLTAEPQTAAMDFYYDTYYSDQNACSSARLIVWTGNRRDEAKERFWRSLASVVKEKYNMNVISSSDKLLNTALCAAKHPDVREVKEDNLIVRMELSELYDDIMDYKGNSGYFLEYDADCLTEIVPLLKNECQTVTYLGDLEKPLRKLIYDYGARGVDRIVRMGHSMDLSFVWDGYDLPLTLSRKISNI